MKRKQRLPPRPSPHGSHSIACNSKKNTPQTAKNKQNKQNQDVKVNQAEISAGDNSPVQVTQSPPPPAQRLNKDDSSFTNQTWQLQPIFRRHNQRADQLDLNMTQTPHYLRQTRHVSRVQNSYLNSRFSFLSSLLTGSSHWLQPSKMISVTMFILMLACLVPVQDTSQQVKLKQFLPQQVKSTHSHHPGLYRGISRRQPDIHMIPSKGTSSAASQLFNSECQTIRLVSSLPSHKNVQRPACGQPSTQTHTIGTSPYTQQPDHITHAILFGFILHSTTTTMRSTAQYLRYILTTIHIDR